MEILNLIRKIDHRIFFPFLSESASQKYYVHREDTNYPYDKEALNESPSTVRSYFEHCARVWQRKKFHFLYTQGCTIEPTLGWGITRTNELIPQSLWNNYVDGIKPSYLKFKFIPKKVIHLPEAVSLQYAWTNYWHFYNDILGQLSIADKSGVPKDTPIIIPAGLAQLAFFKEIVAMSKDLQNRNWILQDEKTSISCDKTHFFNTFWSHRENFDAVLDYIQFHDNIKSGAAGSDRIFISRNSRRGRNILNFSEVKTVLERYYFKIVDCDALNVRQQIDVFQNAAHVVGIHGAGLTNIIYRQDMPMNLLELFSVDYVNPTYFWLCQQYGYNYYSMAGDVHKQSDDFKNNNNFEVNIEEFESKIIAMLSN